jgi:hypothetical protein
MFDSVLLLFFYIKKRTVAADNKRKSLFSIFKDEKFSRRRLKNISYQTECVMLSLHTQIIFHVRNTGA